MKIISKFKDYYDFVAGYDTDPRKVYIRDMKCMAVWERKGPKNMMSMSSADYHKPGWYMGDVWFCDVRYPYLHNLVTDIFYYVYEDISERTRDFLQGLTVNMRHPFDLADHFNVQIKKHYSRRKWQSFYSRVTEKEVNVNTRFKSPVIFTWMRERMFSEYVMDGPLEWVKFSQVMEPRQAFQSLYNWIPYHEPDMPSDPDDMIRYVGKGFDKKTSFRNIK